MEKRVPHNNEAERALLGSILIDPSVLEEVSDLVTTRDFYADFHRRIFETLLTLQRRGMNPDMLVLMDEMQRAGTLQENDHLALLSLTDELPTSAYAPEYARIIARASTSRRLLLAAQTIAGLAYEQDERAVEKAEELLYAIDKQVQSPGFRPLESIVAEYVPALSDRHEKHGQLCGVTTGYDKLDLVLSGLQKTDLLILAARPGCGKTSLATNMAYNAAREGKGVAIFSLEMGNQQLAARLLSMDASIPLHNLRTGAVEDEMWERIITSSQRLCTLPIYINDIAGNPVPAMRAQLRKLLQSYQIDVVMVDYLQLIEPDDTGKKQENRVHELGLISRGLKKMAKDFNVPVLALAQLNRKVEERENKVPNLSDIRDSGAIEEAADIVMFVYRDDYYNGEASQRPGIADVIVSKHRNGGTGTISLKFLAEYTRFHGLERSQS